LSVFVVVFFNFLSNFFTEKNKLKQFVESIEKEKDNLMTENNRLTEEGP
jgi:FtsZ-binding cell division protein ZapB